MKDALIVSAFPGSGKTYMFENQKNTKYVFNNEIHEFKFKDSDSSKYAKDEGWEKRYIDDILKLRFDYDFIFISQHNKVLEELDRRNIPFAQVIPEAGYSDTKEDVKKEWMKRFYTRDNSHIKDFDKFIDLIDTNWDKWTSYENTSYDNSTVFHLRGNQYIGDIMRKLYEFKKGI